MAKSKYSKGSEWLKWDLHVHTASSEEKAAYKGTDSDSLLVQAWKEHDFAAVAITDHFVIDIQRIRTLRQLASNITIFPGVELRTDKGSTNIHPIIIFPENTDLDILDAAFKTFRNDLAESKDSIDTIHWNFKDIVNFAIKHGGLISIHAGRKDNGIESIPNDTPLNMAVKSGYAKDVDIFEVGKFSDISEYETKVFPNISTELRKPIIICSDNHDPRDYKIKEYLWIKANPTFEGLKQILLHREERVFIGNLPPKLEALDKNKSRYIKSITVSKAERVNYPSQNWFDFTIDINSGLVAIIGNKGSGKSALSDIIGHLCKCKTMSDASFLNDSRFRNRKGNISKDYIGNIEWIDGAKTTFGLDTVDYGTTIEDAQYLPQQFIEKTCNDLEESFQDEINNVIFSYIDNTEKGDAINLDELKRSISASVQIEISQIKSDLTKNIENLIRFENYLTNEYRKSIEDNLTKRREDLERHNKNKPQEVRQPKNTQSDQYKKELQDYELKQSDIEVKIKEARDKLKNTNDNISSLELLEQKIKAVIRDIEELNLELAETGQKYGINDDLKVEYATPLKILEGRRLKYLGEREKLQASLSTPDMTNSSLLSQLEAIKTKKDSLISRADATEKAYQAYLERLKEWKAIANRILGTQNDENSIHHYSKILEYININLDSDYKNEKVNFFDNIKKVFDKKKSIVERLVNLYSPVKKELESVLGAIDEKIEFDIEISLTENKKTFCNKLLEHINQNFSGLFYKSSGTAKMSELVEKTDFNDAKSTLDFIETIYSDINDSPDDSNKKAKDNKKSLYSFVSDLEYLGINFILKLGGRSLQELSPGERGIVLLVFYLALDKGEKPLIIDQPEDNLDNQSVYNKLVKCILKAKKRRQVIIVTHNPNIAVACDAEQIIYCSMDKKERSISYSSGAIEDPKIRSHVIDVLEGTIPAFDLRKMKYANELN